MKKGSGYGAGGRDRVSQQKLLRKYAAKPVRDDETLSRLEELGFRRGEVNHALVISDAIMRGAAAGDPRLIKLYLEITGEDSPTEPEKENNLLAAIRESASGEVGLDDIPEIQQTAASDADVVEQTGA